MTEFAPGDLALVVAHAADNAIDLALLPLGKTVVIIEEYLGPLDARHVKWAPHYRTTLCGPSFYNPIIDQWLVAISHTNLRKIPPPPLETDVDELSEVGA
jgi:hypothetical protein